MHGAVHTEDAPAVVFISLGAGYPWGAAASSRVRLLARSLNHAGTPTRVMCLQPSDNAACVENTSTRGTFDGTPYEYTCLTTVQPASRAGNAVLAVLGFMRAAMRLQSLRRAGAIRCAYLYSCPMTWHARFWCAKSFLRLLRIPVILDVCERPWILRPERGLLESVVSPLSGVSGVVAISACLESWATHEASRLHQRTDVVRVPILVDVDEWVGLSDRSPTPTVLLSATSEHADSVHFLAEAMCTVWSEQPDCELVITGVEPLVVSAGGDRIQRLPTHDPRIRLTGFVPRRQLLDEYGKAWVFAVPLSDDEVSRARFPTKLGEYLSCARPVVASRVGEIARFLSHEQDALLAEPDDPVDFGQQIARALRDHRESRNRAARGRAVAEAEFHYTVHAARLANLVESACMRCSWAADKDSARARSRL